MAAIRIQGKDHPLQEVFSNAYVFDIPGYQRPYSWGTEQAGELLDDLLTAVGTAQGNVHELNPYFLGSIVLIKEEGKPNADVVDGQQRLTTLTILLSALRELFKLSSYPDDIDIVQTLKEHIFEKGNRLTGTTDRPRLTLRERDADFFRKYVQEGSNLPVNAQKLEGAQRNIIENLELFKKRLSDLDHATLMNLASFLVTNCLMVVVSTPDLESAYRIFSVMNNRGLDLSVTDILKAEVIGALPKDKQDTYTKRWEDAEEALGRSRFENLFAHLRTIHRKVKQQETLLKEIRRYVAPEKDAAHFIDGVLEPFANHYLTITDTSYGAGSNAKDINRLLRWLNQIDNADWIPVAIKFLHLHGEDTALTLRFFQALEALAAGMMIRRSDVNQRIARYAAILTSLERDEALFASDSPLLLEQHERRAIMSALDGNIYEMKKVRSYILLRLDEALSSGEAIYTHGTVTIEHVLPQNPAAGSRWRHWFNDDEHEAWVHRLGNLVLLNQKRNSAAGNQEFAEKKTTYFKTQGGVTPFVLTTRVLDERTWTPEVVKRHQAERLTYLQKLWGL